MSQADFEAAVAHIVETGLRAAPDSEFEAQLRFEVGAMVMCNLGPDGWKLGRVVALHYREDNWPPDQVAPYQVALEGDHSLIFVPSEDPRYCREATREDLNIERRLDALALPAPGISEREIATGAGAGTSLLLSGPQGDGVSGYRDGRCHGCDQWPCYWSSVELYSEHYRAAARNGLTITRRTADLGTVCVGASVHHPASGFPASGFMQCPTLPRLPPGLTWSDDGALRGEVRFDPHRAESYTVEFVAVSTAEWQTSVGLVRVEITFAVEGNVPAEGFEGLAFWREQQVARTTAERLLRAMGGAWERWEQVGNRETIAQMSAHLAELRELLERHPRLDGGWYWAQLGGFHMNVHKLLENTLYECELYLGHALLSAEAEVRRVAEQNLEGCYQKRLLETARFLWLDGVDQMRRGEWAAASQTLYLAAAKKDGWGWGVNHGDIWIAEAAARLVHAAELDARGAVDAADVAQQLGEATRLVEKGAARAAEGGYFGPEGHPWAAEIRDALGRYRGFADATARLDALQKAMVFWCALVLGGAAPFPPQPRPRLTDAAALRRRLPGHNALAQ